MRNAFATPACPSTTATASDAWFDVECPRAFEQQRGVLLVVAVHHHRVEVLAHQLLNGSKGLGAGFHREFQFAQDLRHRAGGFFLGTEEQSLVTHTKSW